MLKFKGQMRGRPLIGLGLTDENLARLRSDEPMIVDTQELGLEGGPYIVVFAGAEDEAGLAQYLADAGFKIPAEMTTYTARPGEEKVWKQ